MLDRRAARRTPHACDDFNSDVTDLAGNSRCDTQETTLVGDNRLDMSGDEEQGESAEIELRDNATDALDSADSCKTVFFLGFLAASRLGFALHIDIQWGWLKNIFGWIEFIFFPSIDLPTLSDRQNTVLTVLVAVLGNVGAGLRLIYLASIPEQRFKLTEPESKCTCVCGPSLFDFCFEYTRVVRIVFVLLPGPVCIAVALVHDLPFIFYLGLVFLLPGAMIAVVGAWRAWLWKSFTAREHLNQYERAGLYYRISVEVEGAALLMLFLVTYSTAACASLELFATDPSNSGAAVAFTFIGVLPPMAIYCMAFGASRVGKPRESDRHGMDSVAWYTLVKPFRPHYFWFKAWLLVESVIYSMAILLPSRSREKLVVILALVIVFTAVTSVLRPFEGSVENISDMCSRIALIITLAVGLAGQDDGGTDALTCNVVLFLTNAIPALWFLYVLNPRTVMAAMYRSLLVSDPKLALALTSGIPGQTTIITLEELELMTVDARFDLLSMPDKPVPVSLAVRAEILTVERCVVAGYPFLEVVKHSGRSHTEVSQLLIDHLVNLPNPSVRLWKSGVKLESLPLHVLHQVFFLSKHGRHANQHVVQDEMACGVIAQFLGAGYSMDDLRACGLLADASLGGLSASQFSELAFGFSHLNMSASQLFAAGFHPNDVPRTVLLSHFSLRDLMAGGFTLESLQAAGVATAFVMADEEFSTEEIQEAGNYSACFVYAAQTCTPAHNLFTATERNISVNDSIDASRSAVQSGAIAVVGIIATPVALAAAAIASVAYVASSLVEGVAGTTMASLRSLRSR